MIELTDLRAILVLHEQCHFGRAAAELQVSQPALTKRIRAIEGRLGGALFLRHARGVTPTAAAGVLAGQARRILDEARELEERAQRTLEGQAGELRIGAGLTTLLSGLPRILSTFRRRHPGIRITVRDMATADQLEALERNEIDVGFLRMPAVGRGLKVEPLFEDQLRIAAHETQAGMEREKLFEAPFILMSRGVSPTFHDHVLATCHANGLSPNVIQEANQLLTILTLVQAGVGISLVPESMKALRLAGVRILETRLAKASWTVGLAYRKLSGERTPTALFLPHARGMAAGMR